VKVNQSELEALFAAAVATKKEVVHAEGEGGAAAGTPAKPKNVSLLDPRRAQNIAIMLARFKMTYPEIRRAIETVDETVLTVDNLVALKGYIPQPDEVQLLIDHEDKDTLSNPDKFLLEMSKVHNLGPRLESLYTRATFGKKAEEVASTINVLTAAINEVKNSKAFVRYLEVVLKIGNTLNSGSTRGGAYGFKLDTLTKMADLRTTNKELPTLVHYIADKAEKEYPEILGIAKEFGAVPHACRESLTQTTSDLATLKKSVEAVNNALKSAGADASDKFVGIMQNFYAKASHECQTLEAKLKKIEENFPKLAEYFGEQPNVQPEQFFSTINAAVQHLEKARADNEKRGQMAAKAKEAEERRAKLREKGAAAGAARAGAGGGGPGAPDKGVMDNLIGQLHTGDAFALRKAGGPRPGGKPGPSAPGGGQAVANEALNILAKMKQKKDPAGPSTSGSSGSTST